MKNRITLFALLLLSTFTFASTTRSGTPPASSIEYRTSKIDAPKPQTVKIKTSAICEMCKERIEKKLAFTKGVTDVNLDVDSKDKVVTVIFNPKKTSVEKIKKAIAEVGYDADEVVAETASYDKLPGCCKKGGKME
jgi:periplasmic mercuric ion binding protein